MDSKSTVIDVFATFFLLSFTKLLYTSFYVLIYVTIEKNGLPYKLVPGLLPTVDYFSKDHAPFAVIAILILVGPVLLPVILLGFYPVRVFRSLLEKCKVSGHLRAALTLFVEKFYSCYKDGLNGGRDMRSFAFLPFFLRFSLFFGVIFQSLVSFWFFLFLIFVGSSLLIAIVRPYKRMYMNVIDSLVLAVLSLIGILYILYFSLNLNQSQNGMFFLIALCIDFTLPLIGLIVFVIVKLFRSKFWALIYKKGIPGSLVEGNGAMQNNEETLSRVTATSTEVELPDRIVNPSRYTEESLDDP